MKTLLFEREGVILSKIKIDLPTNEGNFTLMDVVKKEPVAISSIPGPPTVLIPLTSSYALAPPAPSGLVVTINTTLGTILVGTVSADGTTPYHTLLPQITALLDNLPELVANGSFEDLPGPWDDFIYHIEVLVDDLTYQSIQLSGNGDLQEFSGVHNLVSTPITLPTLTSEQLILIDQIGKLPNNTGEVKRFCSDYNIKLTLISQDNKEILYEPQ